MEIKNIYYKDKNGKMQPAVLGTDAERFNEIVCSLNNPITSDTFVIEVELDENEELPEAWSKMIAKSPDNYERLPNKRTNNSDLADQIEAVERGKVMQR